MQKKVLTLLVAAIALFGTNLVQGSSDFTMNFQALESSRDSMISVLNNEVRLSDKTKMYAFSSEDTPNIEFQRFIGVGGCNDKLAQALADTPIWANITNIDIELSSTGLTNQGIHFTGLSNSQKIQMNCNLEQSTFTRVFWHELGHVHALRMSEIPFAFRSESTHQTMLNNNSSNFVTDYAMTNAHEDFAESFAVYIDAPEFFRKKAANSIQLMQKLVYIDGYANSH